MKSSKLLSLLICLFFALQITTLAQSSDEKSAPDQDSAVDSKKLFQSFVGTWEGTCRTWLRPDELADESDVKGEFEFVLDGLFLRHTYEGSFADKRRIGEETIVYNTVKEKYQVTWIDGFHMSYGILFSEGNSTETGFVVKGEYSAGPNQPMWGWKTMFELLDNDHLTITAYNIFPDGLEVKAVETKYIRK